jgi:hypothetical protein
MLAIVIKVSLFQVNIEYENNGAPVYKKIIKKYIYREENKI